MERRKAMDTPSIQRQATASNPWKKWIFAFLLLFFAGTLGSTAASAATPLLVAPVSSQSGTEARISKMVYHQLATLPWYGVFDHLQYNVQGSTVTLSGQVLFPLTRSSVENTVKGISGVKRVVNQVEDLPTSPFDNQIRWAEYRALFFGSSPLFRYSLGVNPAIHIIVRNSRVTLVGYVNSQADRQLAVMRARLVPNVFSVTDRLQIA
jgi:hyperosmotically inducible protein